MLDKRGIVYVVEIVVYTPLVLLCLALLVKFGFKREGWLYLLILSIVRIVGGVTGIMMEQQSNPSTTLVTVASTFQTAGLSPLLSATLGFLATVKQDAFEGGYGVHKGVKFLQLFSHLTLGLVIAGGVIVGQASSNGDIDMGKIKNGNNLRHIGVVLFVILIALIAALIVYVWSKVQRIMLHRRTLLKALTTSIPFLAIRVIYTVLSSFAPLSIPKVNIGSPSLAKFNSTHGDFGLYLGMSVIMEFLIVLIYVTAGLLIPLKNDYAPRAASSEDGNMPLYLGARGHLRSESSASVEYKPPNMPLPFTKHMNQAYYP